MTIRTSTKAYITFNAIALAFLANGLRALLARPLPRHLREAGHFQFLTNLSLVLTIISLGINIITVAFPKLYAFSAYLNLSALVAEFIVTFIYWSLKLFFLQLIVNTNEVPVENFIPLWLDFTVHLLPLVFLSIETLLLKKKTPKRSYFVILSVIGSIGIGYWLLLEYLIGNAKAVYAASEYPYPFLNVEGIQRAFIFAGVLGLGLGVTLLFELLEGIIDDLMTSNKEKKSK